MFDLAKIKTQQMMEAVRKERGGAVRWQCG